MRVRCTGDECKVFRALWKVRVAVGFGATKNGDIGRVDTAELHGERCPNPRQKSDRNLLREHGSASFADYSIRDRGLLDIEIGSNGGEDFLLVLRLLDDRPIDSEQCAHPTKEKLTISPATSRIVR